MTQADRVSFEKVVGANNQQITKLYTKFNKLYTKYIELYTKYMIYTQNGWGEPNM